ncbi:MAG: hypothetical protein J6T10_13215 [Methanobrevibacter sp.]|nr:hypothetical protein [Methanobrevibacter sp.]
MWKLIAFLLIILALIYYFMLMLQVSGLVTFTNRKLTPGRMFIPFYYWLASNQEAPKKNKSKLVKPIKVKEDGELSRNESDSDLS